MLNESISRRGFLAAAAVATAGFRRSLVAADPFGGFTVGIQTYTFRNFDLEPALKRTQDLVF